MTHSTAVFLPPRPATVEPSVTRPRVTPPTPGARFQQVLQDAAGTVVGTAGSALGALPGGPVVSAAVRHAQGGAVPRGTMSMAGAEDAASPGGSVMATDASGAGAAGGGYESMMGRFADDSMRLIALQEQIQAENRQYTTISNVLKARHETAKNAISNLR